MLCLPVCQLSVFGSGVKVGIKYIFRWYSHIMTFRLWDQCCNTCTNRSPQSIYEQLRSYLFAVLSTRHELKCHGNCIYIMNIMLYVQCFFLSQVRRRCVTIQIKLEKLPVLDNLHYMKFFTLCEAKTLHKFFTLSRIFVIGGIRYRSVYCTNMPDWWC